MAKPLPKTIYLVGPHSTGKSTLTRALKKYYGPDTPILFEIARSILKEKGYTAATITSPKCFQMQSDVFQAQFAAEKNLIDQGQFFISDRNAIDPILYTKAYSPNSDDWTILCGKEEWGILKERYSNELKSMVVLLKPVKTFLVNDGTRKMPQDWEEWIKFGEMFVEFLNEQGIPYHVIGENCLDLQDRVEKIVEWADASP